MTAAPGFFQSTLPAALLRSAALVAAFIGSASQAYGEVVTLLCVNEGPEGGSFTLRVDYDQRTVAMLRPDGTAYFSSPAEITEGGVFWETRPEGFDGMKFTGSLNRLSGQGGVLVPNKSAPSLHMHGPCRRATQKF
jgi:hypothetical protein